MTVLRVARVLVILLLSGLGLSALLFVKTEHLPRLVGRAAPAVNPPRPRPASSREIRVNLTSEPVSQLTLEITGDYEITTGNLSSTLPGRGLSLASTLIQYTGTEWKLGKDTWKAPDLWITPKKSGLFRLHRAHYRGRLHLVKTSGSKWIAINHVPLEDYIASVVDSEMPADFGEEARKAQAVVARTYALSKCRGASPADPFDLWGDTRSQKYLGYQYQAADGRWLAGETPAGRKAAEETRGIVCRFQGDIFCTYYSAVCGGRTFDGPELFPDAAPPVRSVVCEECAPSSLYRWEQTIPRAQFEARILSLEQARQAGLNRIDALKKIHQPVGRLPRFRIASGHSRIVLTGLDLRNLFGGQKFLSPQCSLALTDREVLIQGAGYGHGVGFCQWGARGLAARGKTFREILQHYYSGIEVSD